MWIHETCFDIHSPSITGSWPNHKRPATWPNIACGEQTHFSAFVSGLWSFRLRSARLRVRWFRLPVTSVARRFAIILSQYQFNRNKISSRFLLNKNNALKDICFHFWFLTVSFTYKMSIQHLILFCLVFNVEEFCPEQCLKTRIWLRNGVIAIDF